MSESEKQEIKDAIKFYEAQGWDWSDIVEFLSRKGNGTIEPHIIRTLIGAKHKE